MRRIAIAEPKMNAVCRISWRIFGQFLGQCAGRTFARGAVGFSVAAMTAIPGAHAQVENVYTVAGVAVDRTAETASIAREQAIAAGHRQAFDRLLARIVPAVQRARLPAVVQRDIVPLVLSFEIEEEKRSSVRYLGKLTFRFRRMDVRGFLQANGVGFAETRSKPVLLLPVFEFAGAKLLWDDPNPWFAAWNDIPPSDGLVPVRLPVGDLADVRDISAEQAAAGVEEQFSLIAERYGASAVLVAQASQGVDAATGDRVLNVSTRYFGGTSANRTSVRSFVYGEADTDEAVIARAAQEIAVQIEEDWKQENLIRFDNLNSLVADIALSELRQWVEMRERLRKIAFIQHWQLVAVSRRKASVRLTYYGDPEQLRIALVQRDLVLEQGAVNWSLRELRETRSEPAPESVPDSGPESGQEFGGAPESAPDTIPAVPAEIPPTDPAR
tara:strand:+ start:16213 stop:17538 length:1326 start_codon:yes stop_codon:yes gene_type:complete